MSEYKILKVIGKGAFGDAYLGLNVKQNKQYVIKQVDIKNKSKQQKQHIFHEVKLLQQFHHINIVSYRDSFIDRKGLLNIVMEYCEGGDMNQIIESMQGNKIPEDKLLYWMAQIALAIFYMHEKKILHRDLKSPNIFILKGNIRLGDFGISKVLDHVRDLAQTNIGTPYYMSPEQYNHKPYSYKSDIWAFGCILYEMCNQRRPFEANNIQALGMKVVRGNFPAVSECYSKELRNLIGEMLSKNPVKRPNIIEILLKPFMKKKLVEYMKEILSKKDDLAKQTFASFLQQTKKLGVNLEQKKPATLSKDPQTQRERGTSAKKNRMQEEKQKQKKERQRKKEELQNQLRKHNEERKEMAQKLRKVEEERKALMARRKSEKSIKSIYQKVQSTAHSSQYPGDKHSSRPQTEGRGRKSEESSKNLIGKVISQVSTQKAHSVSTATQKSHSTSVSTFRANQKKQPLNVKNTHLQKKKKQQQQTARVKQHVIIQPAVQQRKAFKMQQEYQMQFEDCQPQQQYKFQEEDQLQQSHGQQEFQFRNRVPTFANDEDKLAQDIKEIQNLVFFSNQAVEQITKNQHYHQTNLGKHNEEQTKSMLKTNKEKETVEEKIEEKIEEKVVEKKIQEKVAPHEIEQKVQTLKQQIKMKTQHINSIRNQLSNIDFSLSQSEDQQQPKASQQANFKKKQFNPQHAKINDRINMLKQSATTILGTDIYKKFYQYLVTIKQKGRNVKRDYLQQVLGLQKIGAYHLVEQIVRLSRMIEKIPRWL